MGIEHLIYAVVVIGGVVGYWWWTSGRHGANATNVHLGLRADEQMAWLAHGNFVLDFEKKDVALALVGTERVGKTFTLTGTQGGELVMRVKGEDPVRFQRGSLRFETLEEGVDTRMGLSGQLEPVDVFAAHVAGQEPFKVALPRSAGSAVNDWSAAA